MLRSEITLLESPNKRMYSKIFIWDGPELRLSRISRVDGMTNDAIREAFLCGDLIPSHDIDPDQGEPLLGERLDDHRPHDLNGWTIINERSGMSAHMSILLQPEPDRAQAA